MKTNFKMQITVNVQAQVDIGGETARTSVRTLEYPFTDADLKAAIEATDIEAEAIFEECWCP